MFLWKSLKDKINQNGGFANAHAHFDRAYTLTEKDMQDVVYNQLEEKWRIVDGFKRSASVKEYYNNISLALDFQRPALFNRWVTRSRLENLTRASVRLIQE